MDQKPVIQYVGQFYVYGSEVQARKKKEHKPVLPKAPRTGVQHCVYVDPVAVCGIAVAVLMLVVLAVGAFQLRAAMQQYNAQSEQLSAIKRENARLEHLYRTSLDLEAVQAQAEKLGMVPAEELEHRELVVTVGQAPEESTAWENFLWFVKGLLNGVDESRAEVFTDWEIGSVS
ncbi:MAG: hypothetical protein SOW29_10235 [Candidatus Faecousia sp.]|nr:hypothetical protein [Candidatus Faecousia sp.]